MSRHPACHILAAAMLVASTPAALAAGKTQRVSVGSAGQQANSISEGPEISGTGRYVAFESQATNLAEGTGEGLGQIYRRDRRAGTTTLVSVSSAGAVGNGSSGSVGSDFGIMTTNAEASGKSACREGERIRCER